MKIKIKTFISIFLITLSIFFTALLIDYNHNSSKIFNLLSSSFSHFITNYFGNFSYIALSFIFVLGLFLIIKISFLNKIFVIFGYLLLTLFLPMFTEIFKINNLSGGFVGLNFADIVLSLGFPFYFMFTFFWLLLSIFLLLFPIKNTIVKIISTPVICALNIIHKDRNNNEVNRKKYTTKKSHFKKDLKKRNINKPNWLSKVIFESSDKKIEIPIAEPHAKKIKYKLIDSTDTHDEYQEVDTFSKSGIKEDLNNDNFDYYEKLKENWPLSWQNKKSKSEIKLLNDANSKIELDNSNKNSGSDNLYFDDLEIIEEKEDNNKILSDKSNLKYINEKINTKSIENNKKSNEANLKNQLPESHILFSNDENINPNILKMEHKESALILEQTLSEFGIEASVSEIIHGPVVTLYKLIPAPGIKLQRIESLSNNLALRLAAKSIRILAPIPGEKVVGIEVPNRKRILVNFKELVNNENFTESHHHLPIGLGKDIYGNMIVIDLFKMPHILIAGATGAGKSVCVNCIISSILFSRNPENVKLILIDPKIVELKPYNNIPHLLTPVITDPKDAIIALKYLLFEMERRYSLLDQMGARDIVEYQKLKKKKKSDSEDLPFIVTIVDEFADLMSTSGKEAEILFARLAAKARAVGIHLVLATQRPSIDVITGLIKANIPARIAFQVISLQDSRIILDQKGAEKLLGQGDMLYLSPTHPFPIRLQGAFLTKEEVDLIAAHWKSIRDPEYVDIKEFILENEEEEKNYENSDEIDPLFQQAIDIVYETQKASASYLQRRLGIGYNRAARMVEEMEKMGIVGPQKGAKPRDIISSKPSF
jgi:S-DNA-T family DNA segregation ATPase FtsK/SpoIIIE